MSATTNAGDVTIYYSGGSLNFTASTGLLTASGGATVSFDNTGGNVVAGRRQCGKHHRLRGDHRGRDVNVTGGTVTLTAGTGIGADGKPDPNERHDTQRHHDQPATSYIVQAANPLTVSATSNGYSDPSTMTGSDINVSTTTGDMTVGSDLGSGYGNPDRGRRPSAPNGSAVSLTANTLNLTAANGIGTSGAVRR